MLAKTGTLRVWRHSPGDTSVNDRTDDVWRKIGLCQVSAFSGWEFFSVNNCVIYSFRVTDHRSWPKKLPNSNPKICFGGKAILYRKKIKILLRNDSPAREFTYSWQVSWKSVQRKWPKVFMGPKTTTGRFLPLSSGPVKRSRRNFLQGHRFPIPIRLPSFIEIHAASEDIIIRETVRLSLETRLSNLKSVDLTVLELLAFNHPKFMGSRDPAHDPFSKKF